MSKIAFYDTETTGLPLFNEPSEDPRQPHIVQLGACLVDTETWQTLATLDVICRPDNWTIPDDVAAIHGITTEHAADVGVPESLAVEMLLDLVGRRLRVAHNEIFDARIVRIACDDDYIGSELETRLTKAFEAADASLAAESETAAFEAGAAQAIAAAGVAPRGRRARKGAGVGAVE